MTESPIKTITIPSADIGDHLIVLEVHEYRMEFTCYEQVGIDCSPGNEGKALFTVPKFPGMDEMSHSIDEAEAFISGYIKWDGCMNFRFCQQSDNLLLHVCGQEETDKISPLFARLYKLAAEHLPTWLD